MEKIKQIIQENIYCVLSTVDAQNQPWGAPVFFAYDEHYNFYWWTDTESQHSKNIEDNGKVYINIYDSHAAIGKGLGVYAQCAASLVEGEDLDRVREILNNRLGEQTLPTEKSSPTSAMQLYKATPVKWWHTANSQRGDDMIIVRQEVEL